MSRTPRDSINYGLDAPGVVRAFFAIAAAGIVAGCWLLVAPLRRVMPAGLAVALGITCFCTGGSFLLTATAMVWGSKVGKLRVRDRILGAIPWRGDERVLDVGCGHGLMLIGAAQRLTAGGTASGIDLWQREDQAGNDRRATLDNARLAGVAERVDVRDGDARQIPFPDATFDVVLSSWALHNIYDAPGRRQALLEIVRVLKPGGRLAIADIRHAAEYAAALRDAGLADAAVGRPTFVFAIPTRVVIATKPA